MKLLQTLNAHVDHGSVMELGMVYVNSTHLSLMNECASVLEVDA